MTSSALCWPAATFSATLRHGYPARVTRCSGVLPSEPACDILPWLAMSRACASATLFNTGSRRNAPAAAKLRSPQRRARDRAVLASSSTRAATSRMSVTCGGRNGAAKTIQTSPPVRATPSVVNDLSVTSAQKRVSSSCAIARSSAGRTMWSDLDFAAGYRSAATTSASVPPPDSRAATASSRVSDRSGGAPGCSPQPSARTALTVVPASIPLSCGATAHATDNATAHGNSQRRRIMLFRDPRRTVGHQPAQARQQRIR
jgi:hypothetical protein